MSLWFRLAVRPERATLAVAEKFRQVILLQLGTYHADPAGVVGGMISNLGFLRYHVEFEPAAVGGGYYALGAEDCSEVVVHAEQLEYVFDLCAAEFAYCLDAPAVEYLISMVMSVMVVTAAAVIVMVVMMMFVVVMLMFMVVMVVAAAAVVVMVVVMMLVVVMLMFMVVMIVAATAVVIMVVVMMLIMFMVMFMHRQRLVFQSTSDGVA